MTKGDQFTIEFDMDGSLWEVDVEFTGKYKDKNNVRRALFCRLDNPTKVYPLSKKVFNSMLATSWEQLSENEELEW